MNKLQILDHVINKCYKCKHYRYTLIKSDISIHGDPPILLKPEFESRPVKIKEGSCFNRNVVALIDSGWVFYVPNIETNKEAVQLCNNIKGEDICE